MARLARAAQHRPRVVRTGYAYYLPLTTYYLPGTDMIEYWRKHGYTEVAPAPGRSPGRSPVTAGAAAGVALSPEHRALLRDPFGNSQAMLKRLSL